MRDMTVKLGSIAAVAFLMGTAQSSLATVTQWRVEDGGNGHYYEGVPVGFTLTWTQARDGAASRTWLGNQGQLVSITSAEENTFVWANVSSDPSLWHAGAQYHVGPWLGGFQDHSAPDYSEPGGGWRWVSGETFTFRPASLWTNNAYGSGVADENALAMINDFGFTPADQWNDYPSDTFPNPGRPAPIGYVVEYVPSPSAISALAFAGILGSRRRRRL